MARVGHWAAVRLAGVCIDGLDTETPHIAADHPPHRRLARARGVGPVLSHIDRLELPHRDRLSEIGQRAYCCRTAHPVYPTSRKGHEPKGRFLTISADFPGRQTACWGKPLATHRTQAAGIGAHWRPITTCPPQDDRVGRTGTDATPAPERFPRSALAQRERTPAAGSGACSHPIVWRCGATPARCRWNSTKSCCATSPTAHREAETAKAHRG